MGIYLNFGNKGFEQSLRSDIYVDKTGLIEFVNKRLDTEQRFLCVSRPRRFGKSMAAKMLAAYYSRGCDSSGLFKGLAISKAADYREHLNQYNVIHVDMNDFVLSAERKENPLYVVDGFQEKVLAELRDEYPDSVREQECELSSALAQIYNDTKEQFIIIIDEWDALFREAKGTKELQRRYINLLRGLFKSNRANGFLKMAYLTGILPIKKYNTQSAMNNFREYTMLKPGALAEYVGFTECEVRELCGRYGLEFAEAKRWYDGYSFSQAKHIYNPNSLVNAIEEQECDTYWTRTESFESLRGYISMNFQGLEDAVIQMLAGNRCHVDTLSFSNDMETFHDKDDVLTLLIHLGYLAYDQHRGEAYIPNEEVKAEFQDAVKRVGWDAVVKAVQASEQLLRDTWDGDEDAVAEGISHVHMQNTPVLKYNDENSLSCVITLAYYNAMNEYTIVRELPSGRGFADMVFIPKKFSDKPAMIIELKCDATAEGAITQIREKQYVRALEGYEGEILLVGINYDRKTKKHECKIEKAGEAAS